jgi:hypothetical protein
MPRHIFLSYVRENTTVVDRLVKDLQARGVSVWLDRERLLPGQRWRDAIRTAIRGGDLFIACFSTEYLARDRSYMNEELMVAIEELRQRATSRSWFIPVSLDGCAIPERSIGAGETLHDLHWVDLTADWNRGVEMIARAVRITQDGPDTDEEHPAVALSDDEDAGLLDAGDNFLERMAAFGDARARIINAVVEFYATGIKQMEEGPRGEGMAGVRDEMNRRAQLLEQLVIKLRTDIPLMNTAFNAAMKSLATTMAVAGEVGLDGSMTSNTWHAALERSAKTIQSDLEELVSMRERLAGIGRFTTRINKAKKAAIIEIDRLIDAYHQQSAGFERVIGQHA